MPPLQIYFNLTPMNLTITPLTWALYYAGFYVMQILVAFYTLGSFRWQVLLLAAVSFPIYTRALINAIFKKDQKWHVTGQKGAYRSPFAFMVPQVLFFQFLLITTVVGLWKDMGNGYGSLAVAWNATNTLILGGFVVTAWKEGHRARAAIKAQKRAARTRPARPSPPPHFPEVQHDLDQPHPTAREHARRARHRRPGDLPAQRDAWGRRERLRADPRQVLRRRHALLGSGRRPARRRR